MRPFAWLPCLAFVAAPALGLPPNKVLFDATKAQMAGNADWVVDADVHNIGTGAGGAMTPGAGSDSNPQRFPTPAASGITASTAETYWTGSLSAWGVACVQHALLVETLPYNGRITYGDASNVQDLSNYSIYVIDEPNIRFTAAEKTAIINWVHDGGGLFMICDHSGSDRNNDGCDSVCVWNDLIDTNTVVANPFGMRFNGDNISPTSTFVDTTASDPITHGAAGTVGQMIYHNGTSLTVSTAANSSVKAAIWTTATHTNTNVMVAYATYGAGRVVACGDSSPFDDGTGDPNDTLFNGWSGEAGGDHGKLAINATLWLAAANSCTAPTAPVISGSSLADGQMFSVTAAASGTPSPTFQWRKGTTNLTSGGSISGATSATLLINPIVMADAGSYNVVLTNPCGSVASNSASLTVICRADFNGDGAVNTSDIFAFLAVWFTQTGQTGVGLAADVNGDGIVNVNDIFAFLALWFAGCP